MEFISNPTMAPCHLQLWIPALGNILNALSGVVPVEIIDLAQWLAIRAAQVYQLLSQHLTASPDPNLPQRDWCQTGMCYGAPQIQICPKYPGIPDDGLTEDKLDKSDSECGKYYSTYKKAHLTSGLMVLWCRHSICVGCHSIPTSKGCNDIFSAIYCYWPEAPKIIVYDFACQLAPYSWIQEAQFFRNTRFVVDQFHASGHTKCSRALSATFAMQYDANLQLVNTSAAEVGNSGAGKIQKSVSYMTQIHAIQYTKIYMDGSNCLKTWAIVESRKKKV